MRLLAVAINASALICTLYLVTSDWPLGTSEMIFGAIYFAAPLISLVVLLPVGNEGWLLLYLRRRTLEEKKKIEQLQREV
jgi:hypothetical protein